MNQIAPLPDNKFGFTRVKYNLPLLPADLPERALYDAANRFNSHLYQTLTSKQRAFVEEYFSNGFDGPRAAVAAGLSSEDDAGKVSAKLLRKKYIQEAIEGGWAYYRESVKISLPEIIQEIRKVAFSNMGDYLDIDADGGPQIRLPGQEDRHLLAAIQEVTVEEYKEGRGESARDCKRVKFKLYNKMEALEKLLKIANVKGVAEEAANITVNSNTVNNPVSISRIEVIQVPSGQFLPAPQREDVIVERQPMLSLVRKPA